MMIWITIGTVVSWGLVGVGLYGPTLAPRLARQSLS